MNTITLTHHQTHKNELDAAKTVGCRKVQFIRNISFYNKNHVIPCLKNNTLLSTEMGLAPTADMQNFHTPVEGKVNQYSTGIKITCVDSDCLSFEIHISFEFLYKLLEKSAA